MTNCKHFHVERYHRAGDPCITEACTDCGEIRHHELHCNGAECYTTHAHIRHCGCWYKPDECKPCADFLASNPEMAGERATPATVRFRAPGSSLDGTLVCDFDEVVLRKALLDTGIYDMGLVSTEVHYA